MPKENEKEKDKEKESFFTAYTKDLFEFSQSEIRRFFRLSPQARDRTYTQVTNNSDEEFSFYLLSILAAVVITLGLIANSGAVVIGGMLIAPFIWPVLAFSLSVSLGKILTVRKSFYTIVKASFIILVVSAVVGYISPFNVFNEEILSRTEPTFIELLIGLAAGFIGAYTVSSVKISSTIGGVAISVALVPPLCVAGLTLASANTEQFLGAILLYFSNLLAIMVGSLIVFILEGFFVSTTSSNENARKSYVVWSFSLLLLISVPLFALTRQLISENNVRKYVLAAVTEIYPESHVSDVVIRGVNRKDNLIVIDLTVQKEGDITVEEIKKLTELYSSEFDKTVKLNVNLIELKRKSEISAPY